MCPDEEGCPSPCRAPRGHRSLQEGGREGCPVSCQTHRWGCLPVPLDQEPAPFWHVHSPVLCRTLVLRLMACRPLSPRLVPYEWKSQAGQSQAGAIGRGAKALPRPTSCWAPPVPAWASTCGGTNRVSASSRDPELCGCGEGPMLRGIECHRARVGGGPGATGGSRAGGGPSIVRECIRGSRSGGTVWAAARGWGARTGLRREEHLYQEVLHSREGA